MNGEQFTNQLNKFKEKNNSIKILILWATIAIVGVAIGCIATYFVAYSKFLSEKQVLENRVEELEEIVIADGIVDEDKQLESGEDGLASKHLTFDIEYGDIGLDDPKTRIVVKYDGQEIGEMINEDDYYHPIIFQETENNIYIGLEPDGIGGYILYFSPRIIYRISLDDFEFTKIEIENGRIGAISPDEENIAYVDYGGPYAEGKTFSLVIKNIDSDEELHRFYMDARYRTAGDLYFSIDRPERYIVYAAAVGNPDAEAGSIYVIDMIKGTQEEFLRVESGFCSITGWDEKNNIIYDVHSSWCCWEPYG